MLSAEKMEQWMALLGVIGRPELVQRYSSGAALAEGCCRGLASILEEVFITRSLNAWLELLNKASVPCSPALEYSKILHHPHVSANDLFETDIHPQWGKLWIPSKLAKFSASSSGPCRRSPLLGEHGAEILKELGMNSAQIASMREGKVIL